MAVLIVSVVRNKLLAEAYYLVGEIEKYGTGFIRVRKLMKESGNISLELSGRGEFFLAKLIAAPQKTPQKTPQKESPATTIIELLNDNPELSQREISEILGIGFDTVREHFKRLKSEGKIKRIGGRKDGFWEIL